MSHELHYDAEEDFILLKVTGRFDLSALKRIAPEVAQMVEKTGCFRILNDMSTARIRLSFMQVFESPQLMDVSGVSRRTRRALIVPVDFEEPEFLETITRNRGHNLRVFMDLEEGKVWLLGED